MRIYVADELPAKSIEGLTALGLDVVNDPKCTADELPARIGDAAILVVRSTKVTRAAIEAAPRLGLVVRAGAGFDTIDVAAASERGIFVSNCPGKNSVAVAELAMGLILALDRRIVDATDDLRAGKWNKKEYGKADGLKGKTLGLAGLGRIGSEVARRARAFSMHCIAWSIPLDEEAASAHGVERCVTLHELVARADVISVHLPQTVETRRLFNADVFARMKPGAIFVNT
ncbi:MAG TPA: NAD(P)-dependent oxidoreductase, partial [Polyangiaceae bacterium]